MLGLIGLLAGLVGVEEPALRLLISALLAYPIAFVYRRHVYQLSKLHNHAFIIGAGIAVLLFNFGLSAYHTLLAIGVSHLLLATLHGTALIAATFAFHMTYLLVGYLYNSGDEYSICWTMPHCVLVLRLIALAFDVSDGQRPVDQLSAANKRSCLAAAPSLLELYSFALFPASVLIGPQFSMRRFASFINKEFDRYTGHVEAGLTRGAIGLGYLLLNQIGGAIVSDAYLQSAEYANSGMLYKWLALGFWAKFTLYKYISVWLLAEGAATCFGLTFAGQKDGREDWSGCENIKLAVFENASRFQHFIDSFNVNTNHWVAEYVYKRLKHLNNRHISQGAALLFLAVWHGFSSGYYMCFVMEFTIMQFEKAVQPTLLANPHVTRLREHPLGAPLVWVALKLYTLIGLGFSLVPLVLLSVGKWGPVYHTVGYVGVVFFGPWTTWAVKRALRVPRIKEKVVVAEAAAAAPASAKIE